MLRQIFPPRSLPRCVKLSSAPESEQQARAVPRRQTGQRRASSREEGEGETDSFKHIRITERMFFFYFRFLCTHWGVSGGASGPRAPVGRGVRSPSLFLCVAEAALQTQAHCHVPIEFPITRRFPGRPRERRAARSRETTHFRRLVSATRADGGSRTLAMT